VVLSDGTIIAAAGTDGSSKEVAELSDRDRKRLLARGYVHVEGQALGVGSQESAKTESETKLNPPPAPTPARRRREEGD
jgi:hypothetical protein